MDQINTVIEQWHERIGPLQQSAAEARGAYLSFGEKLESLKTPVPEGGLAARAGGYLRKAFGYAFRMPYLLYEQDIAKLVMEREQYRLDSFIVDTTAKIADTLAPALDAAGKDGAEKIRALQTALNGGIAARQSLGSAAISCAQSANNIQWANNKYYFNALQRSQNSERDLRRAGTAIAGFNTALAAVRPEAPVFDTIADITFSKFGPEYSGENTGKFMAAQRRLEDLRAPITAQLGEIKADLLDALEAAAGALSLRSKAFDSMIHAAHQRIKPVGATIGGAPPKADF